MAYELPKCFVDKIELDKKLEDLKHGSLVSFEHSQGMVTTNAMRINPWVPFREEWCRLRLLQQIARDSCKFTLELQKPDGSGRPTQMDIAG